MRGFADKVNQLSDIDVRDIQAYFERAAIVDLQKEIETRRKLQETAVTDLLANVNTAVTIAI